MCVALAALAAAGAGQRPGRRPHDPVRRIPPPAGRRALRATTPSGPGELVTAHRPAARRTSPSHYTYLKLRDRLSYAFALVSVAAVAQEARGRSSSPTAVSHVGGVAHKPWRQPSRPRQYWSGTSAPSPDAFGAAASRPACRCGWPRGERLQDRRWRARPSSVRSARPPPARRNRRSTSASPEGFRPWATQMKVGIGTAINRVDGRDKGHRSRAKIRRRIRRPGHAVRRDRRRARSPRGSIAAIDEDAARSVPGDRRGPHTQEPARRCRLHRSQLSATSSRRPGSPFRPLLRQCAIQFSRQPIARRPRRDVRGGTLRRQPGRESATRRSRTTSISPRRWRRSSCRVRSATTFHPPKTRGEPCRRSTPQPSD